MTSITKLFRKNRVNYSAFSLSEYSEERNKYVVFNDDTSFFSSKLQGIDQWWQISFQVPVTIESYIIKENQKHAGRVISWIVNASMDNKTWETVSVVNDGETYGSNANRIKLNKSVCCMHFRIIEKDNACKREGYDPHNCNSLYLIFSYFDAFGRVTYVANLKCTCKRKISSISLFLVYIFLITY